MMNRNDDAIITNYSNQHLGNYRLLHLLGRGGYASVYLGEHVYLKRLAAIKVLRTVLNESEKARFIDEARLLAGLSHPHIVRVHDFDVLESKTRALSDLAEKSIPFLIMDFMPGGSLRARYPGGSSLFLETVVDYIKQVAVPLQYAHDRGIIHRDIKPENLLLNEQQEVMISDFGLALFAPTPEVLSLQEIVGSLPYSAPEQLRGRPHFASDQYSLGIIAYEWLCGHRPFRGEEIEMVMQHISSAPPSLLEQVPALPPAVEDVILQALAKTPQQRFPHILAFAEALQQASQTQSFGFASHLPTISQEWPLISSTSTRSQDDALFVGQEMDTLPHTNEHETLTPDVGKREQEKEDRPISPAMQKNRQPMVRKVRSFGDENKSTIGPSFLNSDFTPVKSNERNRSGVTKEIIAIDHSADTLPVGLQISAKHAPKKQWKKTGLIIGILLVLLTSAGLASFATTSGLLFQLRGMGHHSDAHANLAHQATVSASSSIENDHWSVKDVNDGQEQSVASSLGWSSGDTNADSNHVEWLQLNLGMPETFKEVDLFPRTDGTNAGYGFPIDFTIEVSNDGRSWTTIVTKTGNYTLLTGMQRFTFDAQNAQYVRVTGTNLRPNPNDKNSYRMQFAEIEIYDMAPVITNVASPQAPHAQTTLYTFTVYTNSSQSNMYVYQSNDGLNYYQASSSAAYTPPTGLVRDPSIMRYIDGRYYMTYTTNWTGNTIGIASSPDRINWAFLEDVTLPSTIHETWAPEWFLDTNGSVNIIVNINSTDNGDSNFIPNKITALDGRLSTWSAPVPLAGLAPNYIDTFLVKVGNTYHAFVKNETTKYIEHATARKLTGPYTFVGTGDWAGWGNNLEGPTIFQLDNGNWRIFMDGYTSGNYYYSDSTDNFRTWTAKAQIPNGLSGFVHHGTVLRETNSTVNVGTFNPNSKYKLLNVHSGKALDVVLGSTADGVAVDQWDNGSGLNQQWELVSVGGGYFKVINVNSGKALDVLNSSISDGGSIDQWTYTGSTNQQWSLILIGDSNYQLINRHSGKALDVFNSSTRDGGTVDQWANNGGANQQWRLEQVL